MDLSRREFIKKLGASCLSLAYLPWMSAALKSAIPTVFNLEKNSLDLHPALFYKKLDKNRVQCQLCPRNCIVPAEKRGYCEVRENKAGNYYTLVHSNPCAVHVDPIEKKPFFHFLPGASALSLATVGCNVECKYCQNWQISQARPEDVITEHLPPKAVVDTAIKNRIPVIAFTYTEPVVFFEYVLDTAKIAKLKGVHTVVISNGYINPDPLREWCKYLSAIKIDLKGITEKFYSEIVNGTLAPVLNTLKLLNSIGIWYEIVYLVIPTLNDSEEDIRNLCKWIKSNLTIDVPLHFSRFYPQYKLRNLPPTPVSTLERCRKIALDMGLKYVYIGNVPNHPAEDTYCPACGKLLIDRSGYEILKNEIKNGKCKYCGTSIAGMWL